MINVINVLPITFMDLYGLQRNTPICILAVLQAENKGDRR